MTALSPTIVSPTIGDTSATESKWQASLLQLLPYSLLLLSAYLEFAKTLDDPYITLRYAIHLLAGDGPVFNSGERVEGYTSPLHLMISALVLRLFPHVDPLFILKLFSLLCAFLALMQMRRLAGGMGLNNEATLLAQCLVAANLNFAIVAVNGLETSLYVTLYLCCLAAYIGECRTGHSGKSGWILFVAALTRPEAFVLFAGLVLMRIYILRKQSFPQSFLILWLLEFLLPVAICIALRFWYYGMLLPNTFYAKYVSLSLAVRKAPGYLVSATLCDPWSMNPMMWRITGSLLLGTCLVALFRLRRQTYGKVLIVATLAQIVFVCRAGGDWMPGWRFMIPILPLLALAVADRWQLRQGQDILPKNLNTLRSGYWCLPALLAFSCLGLFTAPHSSWASVYFSTRGAALLRAGGCGGLSPIWVSTGDLIKTRLPYGATVAYSEMGYAGFTNMDKRFIDTRGLTDKEIAGVDSRYKSDTGVADHDWFLPNSPLNPILRRRQPDFIVCLQGKLPPVVLDHYIIDPNRSTADIHVYQNLHR